MSEAIGIGLWRAASALTAHPMVKYRNARVGPVLTMTTHATNAQVAQKGPIERVEIRSR